MSEIIELFGGLDIPCNELVPTGCTPEESRKKIASLAVSLFEAAEEIEYKPNEPSHFHAPGMYGRELVIRKDELIVGKIHRYGHLNIISKGVIAVYSEFGIAIYSAPITFVSDAGTQRVVYAIEDTVWTTCHLADTENIDEIEKDILIEPKKELGVMQ